MVGLVRKLPSSTCAGAATTPCDSLGLREARGWSDIGGVRPVIPRYSGNRLRVTVGSAGAAWMSDRVEKPDLAASFRPTPGGFVYRAPSGWRLWTRPHFLVDANLRDRVIAASDEPNWVTGLWLGVPWIGISFGGVIAFAAYFDGHPGLELETYAAGLVSAVVGLAAGFVAIAEHKWRRVAPLLRDAPRSQERISLREMLNARRAAGGAVPRDRHR